MLLHSHFVHVFRGGRFEGPLRIICAAQVLPLSWDKKGHFLSALFECSGFTVTHY